MKSGEELIGCIYDSLWNLLKVLLQHDGACLADSSPTGSESHNGSGDKQDMAESSNGDNVSTLKSDEVGLWKMNGGW